MRLPAKKRLESAACETNKSWAALKEAFGLGYKLNGLIHPFIESVKE